MHSGLFASTLMAVAVGAHLMPRPYLVLLPQLLHSPPPSDNNGYDGDICCRVPSHARGGRMGVVAGIYSPCLGSPFLFSSPSSAPCTRPFSPLLYPPRSPPPPLPLQRERAVN